MKLIMQNELYTSIVSSLDLEEVFKGYSDRSRRVKRGLFKSSSEFINVDINGSLNLMRKYDDYKNIPRPINEVTRLVANAT